jgi:ribonucleoside-triphosphate reductase
MSIKSLEAYASYAKYAKYLPEKKRRETWKEQVDRMFDMHERKFENELSEHEGFNDAFNYAYDSVIRKDGLGSQRSLQFGGKGVEKHNMKMFNCVVSWADRPKFFGEMMYMLLCGAGVGFSVQERHIKSLPDVATRSGSTTWMVEDSIEGWADAISILVCSFMRGGDVHYPEFYGRKVTFDLSQIRPEGALISGGFKAPGSAGLKKSIENIEKVIINRLEMKRVALNGDYDGGDLFTKLRDIDVYDICMHAADAVLSGGVRRSASICLFDAWSEAMVNAKTGNWQEENPQRARSNNSAVLIKGFTEREVFDNLMEKVKEFGEPGFIWLDDPDILYNPCVEIGMYPAMVNEEGVLESGWQGCNLTEINGKKATTKEKFFEQCKASAILGTMQASYTNSDYLTPISRLIFEREALLGASITGMMENPDILFDPAIQRIGAAIVLEWNEKVAKWIGINPAARATCIKPAGTSSLLLGTASGVHPHHAKRYIRTVQANRLEFPLKKFQEINPLAVEKSLWSASGTDYIISFLCEVPAGAITKNQLSAIELLENVKTTQMNWVEYGTRPELCVKPYIRHNVSNTITVKKGEWEIVANYIWDNQDHFSGVSLLSETGDKDYIQAPNQTIMTAIELAKEYGDAAVFASGLIVDGLHVFDNLWQATDYAEGKKTLPVNLGFSVAPQQDWLRRAKQFAVRYFDGDVKEMSYCLKMVNNWKRWVDLKRTWVDIDWDTIVEEEPYYVDVSTTGAVACAGGVCEL